MGDYGTACFCSLIGMYSWLERLTTYSEANFFITSWKNIQQRSKIMEDRNSVYEKMLTRQKFLSINQQVEKFRKMVEKIVYI